MQSSARKTVLFAALLTANLFSAKADLTSGLTASDLAILEEGENVVASHSKPGAIWPEVRIYRKVNASPQEVTALFLDYEHANTFIENLVSAKVEKSPSENIKDVRYTVKLPIIFSISYLARNQYEKTPDGFIVKWHLIEPPLVAKSAVGSLRVEAYKGASIICYTNHVEPATKLIAGLRGHAIKEAVKTVDAIAKEAERRSKASNRLPQ